MRILTLPALLLTLAAAACSSTPGNGATTGGSNTTGGGTGSGGGSTGGGGSGTGIEKAARIVVSDDQSSKEYQTNSVVKIAVAGLNPGDTVDTRINVGNIGNTALVFNKVGFSYEAGAPDENPLAFSCEVDDGSGNLLPCDQAQPVPAKSTRQFVIHFTKPQDDKSRIADLLLSTNDPKTPNYKMKFATVAGLARVTLQKEVLDFGFPKPGSEAVQQTQLTSSGASVLKIDEVDTSGLDAKLFEVLLVANIGGKELKAPFDLSPGDSANVIVSYKGNDTTPHVGDIIFKTNDSSLSLEGGPGWKRLKVKVNSTGPCLKIEPSSINFPMTGVGQTSVKSVQLSVCGNEQVCITDAPFDTPGAGPFALDWTEAGGAPTKDKPVCIGVAKSVKLGATYKPTGVSPKGNDGNLVPDAATFVVKSNAAAGAIKVPMTGLAGSGDCPTGVITIAEGDTVTPQTVLHLDGTQSFAAGATIKSYKWSVVQPKGSVSTFTPNTTAPKVVFTPNVAGTYTFQLTVVDSNGKNACAPAIKVVQVLPDQAIHVELLWNTPADKDQTDEGPDAGADLDLHFAHPYATMTDADKDGSADPWFSDAYDCYWYTCATAAGKDLEWGSYDPNVDDNPHLDRDDTDGGGPENMNLTLPQDEKTYAVGVHYYKDHGFGASTATVKIYIFGELTWEKTSTSMLPGDFWYAAQVAWPSTDICSVTAPGASSCQSGQPGNTLFITPKYPTPPL